MEMGLFGESEDLDQPLEKSGNYDSQGDSEFPELAVAGEAKGPTPDVSASGVDKEDGDRASQERLRIIRERIARGFYNRAGIKSKIAERLAGIEDIAQTWHRAGKEKQPQEKDEVEPSQSGPDFDTSEERNSENI